MGKNGLRRFFVLLLAFAAVGTGASNGFAQGVASPDGYRIVALGDSLTVGYQPGMQENSVPYGYADRLYEQALFHGRASLAIFGVIGLRTEGLSRLLQGAADGKTLKAKEFEDFSKYPERERLEKLADGVGARTEEMKAALSEADLVVITIGANDFSDFLRSALALPEDRAVAELRGNFLILLNNYAESVKKTLRQTAALAPHARILISDQYLPVPALLAQGLYDDLYALAVEPISKALDDATALLRKDGLNADVVHIAGRFKGHEGSMTHMSVSLTGGGKPDNHPTDEGYAAIAEAFSQEVWNEYRKPAPRPAGVPISVIVSGKELITDYKPVVKNSRTFIALSDVALAMNADLKWNSKTRTAEFRQNGREVSISIGAKTMTVNGTVQALSTPAYLQAVGKEMKTYVPLAIIADGLGYGVEYSPNLHAAFINP